MSLFESVLYEDDRFHTSIPFVFEGVSFDWSLTAMVTHCDESASFCKLLQLRTALWRFGALMQVAVRKLNTCINDLTDLGNS